MKSNTETNAVLFLDALIKTCDKYSFINPSPLNNKSLGYKINLICVDTLVSTMRIWYRKSCDRPTTVHGKALSPPNYSKTVIRIFMLTNNRKGASSSYLSFCGITIIRKMVISFITSVLNK